MISRLAITSSLALIITSPVSAQTDDGAKARTIQVMGTGKAATLPTIANLEYWVAGEGKTPDEASAALAAKQKSIIAGLSALLAGRAEMTSGNISIVETREPACDGANGYNNRPRLSVGNCAVTGYIAASQGSIRTSAIAKAGTATGLAVRLGARDARLQNFQLADDAAARRAAMADAIADARTRAEAIAAGAGAKLGPVLTIRDQYSAPYGDIMVGANSMMSQFAPPAPPPPPPIVIDVAPRPIETRAQVFITYFLILP